MSETKEYFEILADLIKKLKDLTIFKGIDKRYRTIIEFYIKETENEILDRKNYELWLDEVTNES